MNGQHFKEMIDTVCKTTGLYKYEIVSLIGVTDVTISYWERHGLPITRKTYVISVLRQSLLDYTLGGLKYAGDNR